MRLPSFTVDREPRTGGPVQGNPRGYVLSTSPRTGSALRRRAAACLTLLSAAAMTVLGVQIPAHAAAPSVVSASGASSVSPAKKKVALAPSCATPKKGEAACFALRRTDTKAVKGLLAASAAPNGYGAADLQSAYSLPADGGAGQTIAIVDAYDDPSAEADLAIYREQYGLPACTA